MHTYSVKQAVKLLCTETLYFVSKISLKVRHTLNRQTDERKGTCVRRYTDSGEKTAISILLKIEFSDFLMISKSLSDDDIMLTPD